MSFQYLKETILGIFLAVMGWLLLEVISLNEEVAILTTNQQRTIQLEGQVYELKDTVIKTENNVAWIMAELSKKE